MISSATNPRLKRARRLQGRRARSLLGLFTVEGEDLLEAALAAGIGPEEVLAVPGAELPVPALEVEPGLLAAVGTLGHPARVLATFRTADLPAAEEADLALDCTASATRATRHAAAVAGRPRAGRGRAARRLRRPRPGHVPCALDGRAVHRAARGSGAARPAGRAGGGRRRGDRDPRPAWPVTFLVGAERSGVPGRRGRRRLARNPQAAGVDSLNAAMAGTVALYEARRQRRA